MIDALTSVCSKILKTRELPTEWTKYLAITLPKKGKLQPCLNYRNTGLIRHPSMWKVILSILQPQAENIIAEE